MRAIRLLEDEHRIIERMIEATRGEVERLASAGEVAPVFVDRAVDFIETYADGTHHAKEEGILFRLLFEKTMSIADTEVMQRLIDEHVRARRDAADLMVANAAYRAGDSAAAGKIRSLLTEFITFYPPHMQKEEREFFVACGGYLTRKEGEQILSEFIEFDRRLIHDRYRRAVTDLERR